MEINDLKCPSCGADIPYKDGQNEIKFCIYCGGVLDLKLDITGNIIDETAKAIPHKDCAEDAQSDFSSDCIELPQAYCCMSRKFCAR